MISALSKLACIILGKYLLSDIMIDLVKKQKPGPKLSASEVQKDKAEELQITHQLTAPIISMIPPDIPEAHVKVIIYRAFGNSDTSIAELTRYEYQTVKNIIHKNKALVDRISDAKELVMREMGKLAIHLILETCTLSIKEHLKYYKKLRPSETLALANAGQALSRMIQANEGVLPPGKPPERELKAAMKFIEAAGD